MANPALSQYDPPMESRLHSRDEILRLVGAALPRLRAEYGVETLALFGSVVRGDADSSSDIDLLVEFERPIGLIRFGLLEGELETLLGRKVDLVEPDALHPALRARILSEAQRAA